MAVTKNLWIASLLSATPAFVFGFALAALNSCLVTGGRTSAKACFNGDDDDKDGCPPGTLYRSLDLNATEVQIATSLGVLGAWVGSLLGSRPSEAYGRKLTLLFNNVPILSGCIMTVVGNDIALYIGRFILGIGVGVGSVVAPVLLSEIADPDNVGLITSMNQVGITLAIFVVALVAYGFVTYVDSGWQYVQGFVMIPCLIQIACSSSMYESPKWLAQRGRKEEARSILVTLRSDDADVDAELETIMSVDGTKGNKSNQDRDDEVTWTEVLAHRHAIAVGVGLMTISAMTGINTVIFYSTTIFSFAGFHEAILATSSVGLVNFMSTFVASAFVESWGRKYLLMSGTSIMLVALLVLSIVLSADMEETSQGYVAVFATLVYVVGFAIGIGPVAWVTMSEVCPTRIRTKAFGLFLSMNWFWNLLIGLLTLTAIDGLGGVTDDMDDDDAIAKAEKQGVAAMYFFFAGMCVCALLFMHFVVPETKGKTPEQIMGLSAPLLLALADEEDKVN